MEEATWPGLQDLPCLFLLRVAQITLLSPGTFFTESVELHYSAFGGFSP